MRKNTKKQPQYMGIINQYAGRQSIVTSVSLSKDKVKKELEEHIEAYDLSIEDISEIFIVQVLQKGEKRIKFIEV